MNINQKLQELEKKEKELELVRNKIAKGEVGGYGAPVLIQQIISEINKLREQIEEIVKKRK